MGKTMKSINSLEGGLTSSLRSLESLRKSGQYLSKPLRKDIKHLNRINLRNRIEIICRELRISMNQRESSVEREGPSSTRTL
jgi:hypothetical protein